MQRLKLIIYKICKALGVFALFAKINKNKIPILCYHSIALADEGEFIPGNFIRFEKFKTRINKLKSMGYKFISLGEAIDKIKHKKPIKNEVVITIDDGFKSIFHEMIPYLKQEKIPHTLYLTTNKMQEDTPIFRLLIRYVFWKSEVTTLKIDEYQHKINIKELSEIFDFINYIEKNYHHKERYQIYLNIKEILQVNVSKEIEKSFTIEDQTQISKIQDHITDIQLHTHIHDMTLPQHELKADIQKNMDIIEDMVDEKNDELIHFCYPSGVYDEEHFSLLEEYNIESATTCNPGLVHYNSNLLELPRIIDSQSMDDLVFEAEITGFGEMLRKIIPNR
jgi:peptidoglycan/xylan/chitin deacetylase (PgdA/CDA1 family)